MNAAKCLRLDFVPQPSLFHKARGRKRARDDSADIDRATPWPASRLGTAIEGREWPQHLGKIRYRRGRRRNHRDGLHGLLYFRCGSHLGLTNPFRQAEEIRNVIRRRDSRLDQERALRAACDTILARFPRVRKNSSGYALDAWLASGDLVDLIVGSEGTLGIVTGAEPRAARLTDEPYWTALTQVMDWARENTISSVYSCLAVHAAVLHMDGVERHKLLGVMVARVHGVPPAAALSCGADIGAQEQGASVGVL
jgi:hypothetical protein